MIRTYISKEYACAIAADLMYFVHLQKIQSFDISPVIITYTTTQI